jgi:hypothetical protein
VARTGPERSGTPPHIVKGLTAPAGVHSAGDERLGIAAERFARAFRQHRPGPHDLLTSAPVVLGKRPPSPRLVVRPATVPLSTIVRACHIRATRETLNAAGRTRCRPRAPSGPPSRRRRPRARARRRTPPAIHGPIVMPTAYVAWKRPMAVARSPGDGLDRAAHQKGEDHPAADPADRLREHPRGIEWMNGITSVAAPTTR